MNEEWKLTNKVWHPPYVQAMILEKAKELI